MKENAFLDFRDFGGETSNLQDIVIPWRPADVRTPQNPQQHARGAPQPPEQQTPQPLPLQHEAHPQLLLPEQLLMLLLELHHAEL